MPSKPKSYSYEWIELGHPDEQRFRDGVAEHGNARDACPLCGGRRLWTENRNGYCNIHHSFFCWTSLMVACHDCKRRWGVVLTKCPELAREPLNKVKGE